MRRSISIPTERKAKEKKEIHLIIKNFIIRHQLYFQQGALSELFCPSTDN